MRIDSHNHEGELGEPPLQVLVPRTVRNFWLVAFLVVAVDSRNLAPSQRVIVALGPHTIGHICCMATTVYRLASGIVR